MRETKKYANIEEELPKLPIVLLNTIQSDVLEIKKIDKTCEKFLKASSKIRELQDACYVVYSKYIDKENHKYEKFIFLGKEGEELFDLSGLELELYGLLACTNLCYTDEYKALKPK